MNDAVVDAFRRAAASVPAYRTLLDEHGVDPRQVVDASSYARHAPLLGKSNTFDRFSLDELSVGGRLPPLADVLTSSGHGGRFSFGVTTRAQASLTADMVDVALDGAFAIRSQTTLVINCLPMGVVFSSNCATVATTSVREDMAVALVRAFGPRYDQIVLVSDPLFLKRLLDHARESALDWRRYRVNVVIGEETFGEQFRRYVAGQLGLDAAGDHGRIISSFGVGELGLHLCFETAATVAARRAWFDRPALARDLLGEPTLTTTALPMLFAYAPARTHMEIVDADADGFGRLAVSMLDPGLPIPLLRYQTGDVARRLEPDSVRAVAARHGVELPDDLPAALLAIRGREREALPSGHVAIYKDALYADAAVANRLSGAVRLVQAASNCTMHVQLASGVAEDVGLGARISSAIPPAARPTRVVVWSYSRFPYGMQLDYERKFTYFVPGATNPALDLTGARAL
jgi:phenylacetate-CoA ligase